MLSCFKILVSLCQLMTSLSLMCQREQFTSDHSGSYHHDFVPSLWRHMTEESRITLLVIYSYRQDYD